MKNTSKTDLKGQGVEALAEDLEYSNSNPYWEAVESNDFEAVKAIAQRSYIYTPEQFNELKTSFEMNVKEGNQ